MLLKKIRIKNFRGLQDIELHTDQPATVIVGPNAIGKTTILQAVRLVKAALFPTVQNEALTVFASLGAFNPHTRQVLRPSLLGDPAVPMEIALTIGLTSAEFDMVEGQALDLAKLHITNEQGASGPRDELGLIQFLSSPHIQKMVADATEMMRTEVRTRRSQGSVETTLVIDPTSGHMFGRSPIDQEIMTLLARSQPPGVGLVSAFPADRSMPTGEVNIQIGAADAAAQMQSHIASPETKYARLKQYLVNRFLISHEARLELTADFALIFERLLPGKSLAGLSLTPQGALSVTIKEDRSGAIFDIDQMSSGEKGLVLTFLMMLRATPPGALLLVDEPELHLNPAVCKKILPFLMSEVLTPGARQALVCTHSPEILAAAYEGKDCRLYHLRSPLDISPVYQKDKEEVFEALRRLGASTGDVLFSKGGVFVEGPDDATLLEVGFSSKLAGYRCTRMGGRSEVERAIRELQAADAKREVETPQIFIFDLDRRPTTFASSGMVKILQWDRYCLENYLLDSDAIFDACSGLKLKNPPASRGALAKHVKNVAMKQLKGHVARKVYAPREPSNPGLRPGEVDTLDTFEAIADTLAARLAAIQAEMTTFDRAAWCASFVESCKTTEEDLSQQWEQKWVSACDGKAVIAQLYRDFGTSVSLAEFKRRIMTLLAAEKRESWRVMDSLLGQAC